MRSLFVIAAVLAVTFAIGPRVTVETPNLKFDLGDDLEAYLRQSEAGYTDITDGTEKKIVWADPAVRSATPVSLVYLHGFSATRAETHPLTEQVARQLGANVYYARLRGHGRGSAAFAEATAADWLRDTREAFEVGRRLGHRVYVIGVSTGATLAAWLALQPDIEPLAGLLLISPNFGLQNASADFLTLPWGIQIAKLVNGATYSFEPSSPEHGKYWTTSYPVEALGELMALMNDVLGAKLTQIGQPVLYLRSDRDRVVDSAAADTIYSEMASAMRQRIVIRNSNDPYGHVIAGDILSPDTTTELASAMVEFVRAAEAAGGGRAL